MVTPMPERPISKAPARAQSGIGCFNERTLHFNIKEWYSLPGDRFEIKIDGYLIDLVRDYQDGGQLLIEIQTGNFLAIRRKLRILLDRHQVRLVYPITKEKWIIKITAAGEVISRRKSPKAGHPLDLFNELLRIPDLINHQNFSLEVLMVQVEEFRCADGKGSWRRDGVSIKDRRLLDVYERYPFNTRDDFKRLLPEDISRPFSNRKLAESLGRSVYLARKMTYCLKKMGVIKEIGKNRNELLFEVEQS